MRQRILVVHSQLVPRGGGEGVCAWVLEALKRDYDVSVLCSNRPDFPALNRFFGTELRPGEIKVRVARPALPAPLQRRDRLRRYKQWHLFAQARAMKDIDLRIATEEEGDLGGFGIQYLHFPRYIPLLGDGPKGAFQKWISRVYHQFADVATGTSIARLRRNITVVNSDWTAQRVRMVHGIDSVTIHPPAAGDFEDYPWHDRDDGFLCVGRISPEKRIELVIEILAEVRARGFPSVRLDIVGQAPWRAYGESVIERVRRNADWVTLRSDLPRAELVAQMARHRYGIHGHAEEHFGMAVAEMVTAGAIVFAPRGGGQVEILGDDRLLWSSRDEAVARITAVLTNRRLQEELRQKLAARREHLRPERFVREIRTLVAQTLCSAPVPPRAAIGK